MIDVKIIVVIIVLALSYFIYKCYKDNTELPDLNNIDIPIKPYTRNLDSSIQLKDSFISKSKVRVEKLRERTRKHIVAYKDSSITKEQMCDSVIADQQSTITVLEIALDSSIAESEQLKSKIILLNDYTSKLEAKNTDLLIENNNLKKSNKRNNKKLVIVAIASSILSIIVFR